MIKRGPVDVVVLAAGAPKFEGKAFAELKKQTAAGTIRVLDAMILVKDEAGDPWRLKLDELPKEQQEAVGYIAAETRGLLTPKTPTRCSRAWSPAQPWWRWPSSMSGRSTW